MKPSTLPQLTGTTTFSRDQIGIVLLLVIGIMGQLIVFLIPDPLEILTPQIPMITPQDWSGSYIGTELFFTDNWRTSYSDPWRPFLWEEKREFFQTLYLTGDNFLSSIDQTVVWYANSDENADAWNELNPDTYNSWPIIERRLGSDTPVSYLACNPDLGSSPPQCWYLAYWKHWFTAIFFYRQSNENSFNEAILMQDIRQLTARADQLLMSAPDEPCFAFLCTNNNKERSGRK